MRPSERRLARRFAKRSQVRYWIGDDSRARNAFCNDVSATGAFIVTPHPPVRGTELRLKIIDDSAVLDFHAVVARRAWVAPDLRRLGPTGMGVRFLTHDELIRRLTTSGEQREPAMSEEGVYRLVLEDDKGLLERYAREIAQGGLLIPTDDLPPLNNSVVIQFVLPFGGDDSLRIDATVVQHIPPGQEAGGSPASIAVAFDKGSELLHRLADHLPLPPTS